MALHYGDSTEPGQVDTAAVSAEMDATIKALNDGWYALSDKWVLMFTPEQSAAADARFQSLRGLIDTLDTTTRNYVLTDGGPFLTPEAAWASFIDGANQVTAGLTQLGGFVAKWSLTPTLQRIGSDVGGYVKSVGFGLGAATIGLGLAWFFGRGR